MPPKRKNNNTTGSTEVASADIHKKQRAISNDDAKCDDNEIVDLVKNRAKEESFATETEQRDENNDNTEVTNPVASPPTTTDATTDETTTKTTTTDETPTKATTTDESSTESKSIIDNQIIDVDTKNLQQQQSQSQQQVIQSKAVGDVIIEQIRDDAHPTTVHQIIRNKDNTMYAEQLISSTSFATVYQDGVKTEISKVTNNDGTIKVTTIKSKQDENGHWVELERDEHIE